MKQKLILLWVLLVITTSCRPIQQKSRQIVADFLKRESKPLIEKAERQIQQKIYNAQKQEAKRWMESRVQANINRILADSFRRTGREIVTGFSEGLKIRNSNSANYQQALPSQNYAPRSFEARFPAVGLKRLYLMSSADSFLILNRHNKYER